MTTSLSPALCSSLDELGARISGGVMASMVATAEALRVKPTSAQVDRMVVLGREEAKRAIDDLLAMAKTIPAAEFESWARVRVHSAGAAAAKSALGTAA